jgi:hypothetical protein
VKQLCLALVVLLAAAPALAQTTPPPPMPTVQDEPLPEWHPPARRATPVFLTLSPDMVRAQKTRQVGLWISAVGWVLGFASGIVYVTAVMANNDLSSPQVLGVDPLGNTMTSTVFRPELEDKRNALENASLSMAIIGGVMAIGGFALFTSAQWKVSSYHKRHPKEPLPPLSGF